MERILCSVLWLLLAQAGSDLFFTRPAVPHGCVCYSLIRHWPLARCVLKTGLQSLNGSFFRANIFYVAT